jgi:hypothetical protein
VNLYFINNILVVLKIGNVRCYAAKWEPVDPQSLSEKEYLKTERYLCRDGKFRIGALNGSADFYNTKAAYYRSVAEFEQIFPLHRKLNSPPFELKGAL